MQFLRMGSMLPRRSESRSVALRKQQGWCSASNTYTTCRQPNCASAVDYKEGHFRPENRVRLVGPLLWNCSMVAKLFGPLTI